MNMNGGAEEPAPTVPPPPLANRGNFGARLTGDATATEGDVRGGETQEDAADEVEAEVCFICASPVRHNSVTPCNHRTCHICALRYRALYKTKACAHCRVREYSMF